MLFGKQKERETEKNAMFNMEQIGMNLMKYRKAAGLTQMGLADKLGISFQAVSNWERGLSCPDISKLSELSELFGVSIDELLGNEQVSKIVSAIETEETAELTAEDFQEVVPLLTQEQADSTAEKITFNKDDLTLAAPFLSSKFLYRVAAEQLRETKNPREIDTLLPFLHKSDVATLAKRTWEQTESPQALQPFLPFMCQNHVAALAKEILLKTKSFQTLAPFLPFMAQADIEQFLTNSK